MTRHLPISWVPIKHRVYARVILCLVTSANVEKNEMNWRQKKEGRNERKKDISFGADMAMAGPRRLGRNRRRCPSGNYR